MEVPVLIGARSGSKGLPGKNVRLLNGRPLLSYAIETARRFKFVKIGNGMDASPFSKAGVPS